MRLTLNILSKNEIKKQRQTDRKKYIKTDGQTKESKTDRLAGWLANIHPEEQKGQKEGRCIDRKTDR